MKRLTVIVCGDNHELATHKRAFRSTEIVLNTDTGEMRRGPGMWSALKPWVRTGQEHTMVTAAVTTNVTIATALTAGASFGGVTLSAGQKVLLMGQSDAKQNGIYTVSGSPARTPEFATMDLLAGKIVGVSGGTLAGRVYVCTNDGASEIGVDDVVFTVFDPTPIVLQQRGQFTRVPAIDPVLDTDVLILERADGSKGRVTAAVLKTYMIA